ESEAQPPARGRAGSAALATTSRSGPRGPSALPVAGPDVAREHALPQSQARGSDFEQLVLADPFERLLERELGGRKQVHALLGGGGAHVGELLLLHDVDVDVLFAGVLAHDHPFVDALAGTQEHLAAVLNVLDRVGGGLPRAVGDQRAGDAVRNLSLPDLVAVEQVVEPAGA